MKKPETAAWAAILAALAALSLTVTCSGPDGTEVRIEINEEGPAEPLEESDGR